MSEDSPKLRRVAQFLDQRVPAVFSLQEILWTTTRRDQTHHPLFLHPDHETPG